MSKLSLSERSKIFDFLDQIFVEWDLQESISCTQNVVSVDNHPNLMSESVMDQVEAVDGTIGVGKTTLCSMLYKYFSKMNPNQRHCMVEESVLPGALDMFYKDPKGMAEQFQLLQSVLCLSSARLALITANYAPNPGKKKKNNCLFREKKNHLIFFFYLSISSVSGKVILDRSPLGNLSFALLQHLDGNISKNSLEFYKINLLSSGPLCFPNTTYLHVEPKIAQERIQQRRKKNPIRNCEKDIPISYLERLGQVMLLVCGYVAATGRANVKIVDWSSFGSVESLMNGKRDEGKNELPSLEKLRNATSSSEVLELFHVHPSVLEAEE